MSTWFRRFPHDHFRWLLSLSAQRPTPHARLSRQSALSTTTKFEFRLLARVQAAGSLFIFPILSHRQSRHDLKRMCFPIDMYITPVAIPSCQERIQDRPCLPSILPTYNGYACKVQESSRLPFCQAGTIPLEVNTFAGQLCYQSPLE
jgi:hypothetical protein